MIRKPKSSILVVLATFLIFIIIVMYINKPSSKIRYWYENNLLVAHALGGIDGKTYTNSIDALEYNYSKGHRVFEVDLSLTSDGFMVGRHGWEADLANLYEQEIPNEIMGKAMELSSFKKYMIYRKYKPTSLEDILIFMKKHKDVYLITDTKATDEATIKNQFSSLVSEVKNVDKSILNRIVPQIYNEDMFYTIKNIYDFKNIVYTLYMTNASNDQVLSFASKNSIKVITMSTQRYSKEFVDMLSQNGIYTYIHTLNSLSEIEKYKKDGVHGFYTDFIIPSDFKYINVK